MTTTLRLLFFIFFTFLIPLTNSCVRMIPPEEVSAGTTVASPPGTDDGEEAPTAATEAPEAQTPAAGGGGGEEIPAGTCNVQLSNSIIGTNPSPVDFNGSVLSLSTVTRYRKQIQKHEHCRRAKPYYQMRQSQWGHV